MGLHYFLHLGLPSFVVILERKTNTFWFDYTPQQFPGNVRALNEICLRHYYRRADLQVHYGRGYVVAEKD